MYDYYSQFGDLIYKIVNCVALAWVCLSTDFTHKGQFTRDEEHYAAC